MSTQDREKLAEPVESLRHDLAHMEWAVSHATPDKSEVSFDYTLVANVLGYIKRLRVALRQSSPAPVVSEEGLRRAMCHASHCDCADGKLKANTDECEACRLVERHVRAILSRLSAPAPMNPNDVGKIAMAIGANKEAHEALTRICAAAPAVPRRMQMLADGTIGEIITVAPDGWKLVPMDVLKAARKVIDPTVQYRLADALDHFIRAASPPHAGEGPGPVPLTAFGLEASPSASRRDEPAPALDPATLEAAAKVADKFSKERGDEALARERTDWLRAVHECGQRTGADIAAAIRALAPVKATEGTGQ